MTGKTATRGRRPADSFEKQKWHFGKGKIRYTREKIAEKYPARQSLYWYRSNEMWKKVWEGVAE
jgi:hypothetical protein